MALTGHPNTLWTPPALRAAGTAERLNRVTKLERATFNVEQRADGTKIGRLIGYLSVFGNKDAYGTVMVQGAFTKTLAEKDTFPLLADHDASAVIGKFTAKQDEFGLLIDAELLLDIPRAYEKWVALKAGAINGLSVGFNCVKEEWDAVLGVTRLLEVRLWEGSVVTFPANDLALVEELRSLAPDVRRALRPVTQVADELRGLVKVFARALGGDKEAQAQAIEALDETQAQFEALRSRIERAAAGNTQQAAIEALEGEKRQEITEEQAAELMAHWRAQQSVPA